MLPSYLGRAIFLLEFRRSLFAKMAFRVFEMLPILRNATSDLHLAKLMEIR